MDRRELRDRCDDLHTKLENAKQALDEHNAKGGELESKLAELRAEGEKLIEAAGPDAKLAAISLHLPMKRPRKPKMAGGVGGADGPDPTVSPSGEPYSETNPPADPPPSDDPSPTEEPGPKEVISPDDPREIPPEFEGNPATERPAGPAGNPVERVGKGRRAA